MPIRINGSSGIDIDSIVKEMMTAKRMPLDKLGQKKQVMQWQRDSYREVNSKIVDFRNNKLQSYSRSDALISQKAVVNGNTSAVKAVATANTNGIAMEVQVNTLATRTTLQTTGIKDNKFTSKSSLSDLASDSSNLPELYKFEVNKVEFEFEPSVSISTVISKINASNAGVIASFDELSGKLTIAAKEFGVPDDKNADDLRNLSIVDSAGKDSLLNLFGGKVADSPNNVPPIKDGIIAGVNSEAIINDVKVTNSSNTFIVNGIQLTLNEVTKETNAPTAKISTEVNTDTALQTMKSLINDYNELINYLTTKTSEEKYRDFLPLTDEQRKAMNETDIKSWEDKAKSGLLKNDDILKNTLSLLRSAITDKLGDLSSLGITTGQYFEGGKLYLDEEKFKKAVQDNPQKLLDTIQGPYGNANQGLANKLSSTLNSTLDTLVARAGTNKYSADITSAYKSESVMGKQLTAFNKDISSWQTKLANLEDRYYKQFSAMETAMNKLNSQASNLAGYFK